MLIDFPKRGVFLTADRLRRLADAAQNGDKNAIAAEIHGMTDQEVDLLNDKIEQFLEAKAGNQCLDD